MSLIKPKQITVKCSDGVDHEYTISKFPAVIGREIVAKYTSGLIPKTGEYSVSEDAMLKLMKHVAVDIDGNQLVLKTQGLIDNHVEGPEVLIRLEIEVIKYNTSFFNQGSLSSLGGFLTAQLQKYAPMITKTLTDLQRQSSQADSPATKNSETK
jgi:hypothetical protein